MQSTLAKISALCTRRSELHTNVVPILYLAALFFASLTACSGSQPTKPHNYLAGDLDSPFTAVVVAYAPELKGVLHTIDQLEDASIDKTLRYKGVTYRIGQYKNQPILVFATGMSIANAAMTTQMALDYFPIDQVVYMGIAGAVNPKWQPGDVIVPERWYYHDESVYSNPVSGEEDRFLTPEYYQKFLAEQPLRRSVDENIGSYKPYKFMHPDEVVVIKAGLDEPIDKAYFAASPRLLNAAEKAMAELTPPKILGQREAVLSVGGNGVTGSVFVDNREYRHWLREVFTAEVTEMESAAIGQVCWVNDVDWVVIRAISDLAGGQEGVNVEHIYDEEVSRLGALVLFALLDQLATEP